MVASILLREESADFGTINIGKASCGCTGRSRDRRGVRRVSNREACRARRNGRRLPRGTPEASAEARPQAASPGDGRRRGLSSAVRARVAHGGQPRAPQHRPDTRRRRSRRLALYLDALHRGLRPQETHRARGGPTPRSHRVAVGTGSQRARRSARRRTGSPRREASEHTGDAAQGEPAGRARVPHRLRPHQAVRLQDRSNRGRHHARHRRLHGSRTARGKGRRCAGRHLCARLCALRVPLGVGALRPPDHGLGDDGAHERGSAPRHRVERGATRRSQRHHRQGHGEVARRPLLDLRRDDRRSQGGHLRPRGRSRRNRGRRGRFSGNRGRPRSARGPLPRAAQRRLPGPAGAAVARPAGLRPRPAGMGRGRRSGLRPQPGRLERPAFGAAGMASGAAATVVAPTAERRVPAAGMDGTSETQGRASSLGDRRHRGGRRPPSRPDSPRFSGATTPARAPAPSHPCRARSLPASRHDR